MASVNDDLLLTINISGLPFNHNTCNYSNYNSNEIICNTSMANMGIIKIDPNTTTYMSYNSPNILTFSKSQPNADIKIDLLRVSDNLLPNLTGTTDPAPLSNMIFYFDIYGVDLSDNCKIKNRSYKY